MKNLSIFATVSDQETKYFGFRTWIFYVHLVAAVLQNTRLFKYRDAHVLPNVVSWSKLDRRIAFSIYFNFSCIMTKKMENYSIANNSNDVVTSAHETCTQFLAFIKANYPQVKYVKFKQVHKWYIFRGQWKRRKLYVHGYTPEYAMSRFLLEILRKVFTERLMTPEEYQARRAELRRRVMMNYPVYELPKNVAV